MGTGAVAGVEGFQVVSSTGTATVPAAEMLARFNSGYGHAPTAGADKLLGGHGADSVNGGGGDGTMEGGNGDDRLAGGADVFVFRPGGGHGDRVEGFEAGADRIEAHAADGCQVWAAEGADAGGGQGTWVHRGPDHDAVFLLGASGVGLDVLLV